MRQKDRGATSSAARHFYVRGSAAERALGVARAARGYVLARLGLEAIALGAIELAHQSNRGANLESMLARRHATSCAVGRGRWGRTRRSLAVLGPVLSFFACYDANDRCDPGEVLFADSRCVCDVGMVPAALGCVPCGENETATATGCECTDGFARPEEGAACEEKPSGQGNACSNQMPCATSAYSYCYTAGGYCTSAGCSSSTDCSSGYACDTSATP